jgi:hypothetical protein
MFKVWNPDAIKNLLRHSDKAVVRALVQIWQRQTYQEKNKECATESNGRGFTAPDAFVLSHYAKAAADGQSLTIGEIEYCRPRLMKYTRQLMEVIAEGQLARLTGSASETSPSMQY